MIGEAYQPHPRPALFQLLLQTKALTPINAWATLACPLGDPWVTQGSPRRHPIPDPIPIPSRQRVANSKKPRGAITAALWGRFSQLPRANYQEPLLSSFFCQRSRPKAPSSPEPNSMFYHLFALVSSKKSAKNAAVNSKLSDATGWSRHLCLVTTFFDNRIR